ncbi:MAG: PAS domain S-box protein [Fimbriimonadaceae bacterium]|nr:PAS domain S-box protein [Fimbriimonadaceae bacterium]
MFKRRGQTTGERAAFTGLLRRSACWLTGLLVFMLAAQIASWKLSQDAHFQRLKALETTYVQDRVSSVSSLALSLTAPMSLKERANRVAEIEIKLAWIRKQTDNNVANGAVRNFEATIKGLSKDPNWKTGKQLSNESNWQVTSAAAKTSFQFASMSRRATEEMRLTSESMNQTRLYLLLFSVGAFLSGYILFLHPTAKKLLKFYFQFEEALGRIETQRAELQTQNIKLREQTALAEEQKHDLEELSRLYRSNANQFQSLFAGLPVACYAMRKTGEIYEWNSACEKVFGISEAEALRNTPWDAVLRGEDAEFVRSQFNKALTGKAAGEAETQITRLDGEKRWIINQSIPITDISGNVTGVLTAAVDITERKVAEVQLNESRTLVSRMMESSPQIAYVLDLDTFNLSYANSQISRLIGMSAQEMSWRSTSLRELVHPDDESLVTAHYEGIQNSEEERIFEVEFRVLHVSGSYRWVRTREVVFQRDDQGRVSQVVGSAEDITQRRADEERLRLLSVVAEKNSSAIVIADPRRQILFANPAYGEITGYDIREVTGPDGLMLESIIVPGQEGWASFDHALQRGTHVKADLRAEKKNGELFWLSVSVTPVHTSDHQLSHYVAILDDVTSVREVQNEIATSRERFDFALRNSRSAAFDWDIAANHLQLSSDMETLFGFLPGEASSNYDEWLDRVFEPDREALLEQIESVRSGTSTSIHNEHRLRGDDQSLAWTLVTGEVIKSDADDQPRRFIGTFTDIGARKDAEQKLADSEQRWNFALEGSGAGVWDWNIESKSVFLSRQWKSLLGYSDAEFQDSFSAWESCIHEDDKSLWLEEIKNHLSGRTDMLSIVVRMRHKSGEWRWFHDRGKVVGSTAEGRPTRMIGLVTDITEQKLAALNLEESETRFRSAITALREGFILQERDGRIRMANPQAADITGVPLELLIDGREDCFLDGALDERGGQFARSEFPTIRALNTGEPTADVLVGLKNQGPEPKWIEMSAAPLFRPGDSEPYAAVTIFADVTERRIMEEQMFKHLVQLQETQNDLECKQEELLNQQMELQRANERLNELATTDGLTGLMNHRHFQETLEKAMEASRAANQPLSLALIDVDHFKKFNDTFGHLEGDEVLRSVAKILSAAIGEKGVVARYGGEEFIVLLPGLKPETAVKAVEKARLAIAKNHWTHREITVSIGVATLLDTETTRTEFANRADMALYRSKESGRNQVTHAKDMDLGQAA